MKIIHITDSHGSMKSPEGRKDVYYATFLRKLYELGYVIRHEKADAVIHTGDLFHTARVADKLAGLTAEIIRSWKVPVYVVPGNHDIEGYSMSTIEHTKLGLLAKAGVIKILDRISPITVDCKDFTVAISGQEFYQGIDEGNPDDFMMQQDAADFNILCYHGLLTDHQMPMKHTLASSINTDADVILCGHLHTSFTASVGNTDIYNPGSMMRIERTEYNKNHMPQYGVLEVTTDANGDIEYSYEMKKFRCARPGNVVFDFASKQLAEQREITLENFRASLQATANGTNSNNSQTLHQTLLQLGATDQETLAKAEKLYADAIASAPDKFEFKQGYVAASQPKYITKVQIRNFQSHVCTDIDFDNGLNVIVGESNQGKTALLRAILWAVDNQPLGTDFITTGSDVCSVKIIYSDGTSITRTRSAKAKSSGTYEADIINDNGQIEHRNFEGFTNAVPVEIDNVHQMPKVAITKDIETHLNLMSQLEGPFLITASPQNKAAAIGRLTGTHIADLATSKASTEIRQLGIEVKKSEDMRKQIESELKQLPDKKILDAASEELSKIVKGTTTLRNNISRAHDLVIKIRTADSNIENSSRLLKNSEAVRKAGNVIRKISDDASVINKIQQTQKDVYGHTCMIDRRTTDIAAIENMKKLKPTLVHIDELAAQITAITNALGRIKELTEQVKECYNKKLLIGYIKTILTFFTEAVSDNLNTLESLNKYNFAIDNFNGKIDAYSTEIGEIDASKQLAVKAIQDVTANMTEAIIDVGICPCCGQKIGAEHVDRVKGYILGGTANGSS